MALGYAVSRVLDIYPHLDPPQVEARLAYGSFAGMEHRFVYVEVPKAACTTMKMLLRELHGSAPLKLYAGYSRETHRNMFLHARENAPFPPLTALDDGAQRELLEADDVLRFTVVRNPHSRLVSAWRDKVYLCEPSVEDVYVAVRGSPPDVGSKHPIRFAEFVAHVERTISEISDAHWRRQVDLTYPRALQYTHVGKTEDLDPTVELLFRHTRHARPAAIPRANSGALRPEAHYDDELAHRVHAIYDEDFAEFGYDAMSWPRDGDDRPLAVAEERFIDEIVERNLIIRHLYGERERLTWECDAAYRYSLVRVKNVLRRMLGAGRST